MHTHLDNMLSEVIDWYANCGIESEVGWRRRSMGNHAVHYQLCNLGYCRLP